MGLTHSIQQTISNNVTRPSADW